MVRAGELGAPDTGSEAGEDDNVEFVEDVTGFVIEEVGRGPGELGVPGNADEDGGGKAVPDETMELKVLVRLLSEIGAVVGVVRGIDGELADTDKLELVVEGGGNEGDEPETDDEDGSATVTVGSDGACTLVLVVAGELVGISGLPTLEGRLRVGVVVARLPVWTTEVETTGATVLGIIDPVLEELAVTVELIADGKTDVDRGV